MGRPSEYNDYQADEICRRIAEGESLKGICREEDFPSHVTIFKWLSLYPEFANRYARAREVQAETLAYEALEIADDRSDDWKKDPKTGNMVPDYDTPQRAKLRIDQRRWMAGKLQPGVYGDKLNVEHSGSITILAKVPTEDLYAELEQLLATGVLPEPIEGEYRVVEAAKDAVEQYLLENDL